MQNCKRVSIDLLKKKMLNRKGVKEKQCKRRGVKTTTTLELGTVQFKNKLSTYLVIVLPH